jgi:hypothetical protein
VIKRIATAIKNYYLPPDQQQVQLNNIEAELQRIEREIGKIEQETERRRSETLEPKWAVCPPQLTAEEARLQEDLWP